MTTHTITFLSMLAAGTLLLIVGAIVDNSTLLTVGTTIASTAVAYGAGKVIANKTHKE